MSNKEEISAPTEEAINALWEEYQRVFYIYWNARTKALGKAIASVSGLQATSSEAYEAYRLARYYPRAARREAPKDILARFSWLSFRAVGRRILGRKK